jgi:hypothetical protein
MVSVTLLAGAAIGIVFTVIVLAAMAKYLNGRKTK